MALSPKASQPHLPSLSAPPATSGSGTSATASDSQPETASNRPACDLCHARKIKCNRNDPCSNCIDAKTQCVRTRVRHRGRPRLSTNENRNKALLERISFLETALHRVIPNSAQASPQENARPTPARVSTPAGPPVPKKPALLLQVHGNSPRGTKRIWDEDGDSPSVVKHPKSASDSPASHMTQPGTPHTAHPVTQEAQACLTNVLKHNTHLASNRRDVLKSALSFVTQLSRTSLASSYSAEGWIECDQPLELSSPPSAEFLFMMLDDSTIHGAANSYCFEFSKFISNRTLERMGIALLEESVSEPMHYQYAVCVNVKAYLYLTSLITTGTNKAVVEQLRKSRETYRNNAVAALSRISVLAPPGLSLVQAFLAGAALMQLMGHAARCRDLVSQACQLCVSFGWHTPNSFQFDRSDEAEAEILATVHWCFVFDRALSMFMSRPPSLPPIPFISSDCLPADIAGPYADIIRAYIELAKVQDLALRELYSQQGPGTPSKWQAIIDALKDVKRHYDKIRSQPPYSPEDYLPLHWESIDFGYYSTMCTVIRSNPDMCKDRAILVECISNARQALLSLLNLERSLGPLVTMDLYPLLLSWTLLIQPLSPFFAIFCHVTATSNREDFDLLERVVNGLETCANQNQSFARLHHLLTTFVSLCRPLVELPPVPLEVLCPTSATSQPLSQQQQQQQQQTHNSHSFNDVNQQPIPRTQPLPMTTQFLSSNGNNVSSHTQWANGRPQQQQQPPPPQAEPLVWNDELLWQLFDVQPSLDWFMSDIPALEADNAPLANGVGVGGGGGGGGGGGAPMNMGTNNTVATPVAPMNH